MSNFDRIAEESLSAPKHVMEAGVVDPFLAWPTVLPAACARAPPAPAAPPGRAADPGHNMDVAHPGWTIVEE